MHQDNQEVTREINPDVLGRKLNKEDINIALRGAVSLASAAAAVAVTKDMNHPEVTIMAVPVAVAGARMFYDMGVETVRDLKSDINEKIESRRARSANKTRRNIFEAISDKVTHKSERDEFSATKGNLEQQLAETRAELEEMRKLATQNYEANLFNRTLLAASNSAVEATLKPDVAKRAIAENLYKSVVNDAMNLSDDERHDLSRVLLGEPVVADIVREAANSQYVLNDIDRRQKEKDPQKRGLVHLWRSIQEKAVSKSKNPNSDRKPQQPQPIKVGPNPNRN